MLEVTPEPQPTGFHPLTTTTSPPTRSARFASSSTASSAQVDGVATSRRSPVAVFILSSLIDLAASPTSTTPHPFSPPSKTHDAATSADHPAAARPRDVAPSLRRPCSEASITTAQFSRVISFLKTNLPLLTA
ncbi:hypothetical protein M0R45_001661 [Rubus argutus]|uniref:Uncharacterized protein n=1 Tax=Rubus argutus TaxID=59490 RepID=A0AAW1VKZ4_RUBAR